MGSVCKSNIADKHRGHPLKLSISPPLQGTLAPRPRPLRRNLMPQSVEPPHTP